MYTKGGKIEKVEKKKRGKTKAKPEKKQPAKKVAKKKTKSELEKANPKGFDVKPKSIAVATAIKNVLSLDKFKAINLPQATLLHKYFKNFEKLKFDGYGFSEEFFGINSGYKEGILFKESIYHDIVNSNLSITEIGFELVTAINNRIESLQNQKTNLSLFDGLKGTAENKDTIAFNKEVLKAKREGVKPEKVFVLGSTKGVIEKFIGKAKISISGETILKAMHKDSDHIAGWHHFINLPDHVNNPIAIFESKTHKNGFVILTELKNHKEEPLMVAIHINKSFKIVKIASIYSKKNSNIYRQWYKDGLCLFVSKKMPLDKLLPGTIPLSPIQRQNKDTKKTNTPKKGLKSPVEVTSVPTAVATVEPKIITPAYIEPEPIIREEPTRAKNLAVAMQVTMLRVFFY